MDSTRDIIGEEIERITGYTFFRRDMRGGGRLWFKKGNQVLKVVVYLCEKAVLTPTPACNFRISATPCVDADFVLLAAQPFKRWVLFPVNSLAFNGRPSINKTVREGTPYTYDFCDTWKQCFPQDLLPPKDLDCEDDCGWCRDRCF